MQPGNFTPSQLIFKGMILEGYDYEYYRSQMTGNRLSRSDIELFFNQLNMKSHKLISPKLILASWIILGEILIICFSFANLFLSHFFLYIYYGILLLSILHFLAIGACLFFCSKKAQTQIDNFIRNENIKLESKGLQWQSFRGYIQLNLLYKQLAPQEQNDHTVFQMNYNITNKTYQLPHYDPALTNHRISQFKLDKMIEQLNSLMELGQKCLIKQIISTILCLLSLTIALGVSIWSIKLWGTSYDKAITSVLLYVFQNLVLVLLYYTGKKIQRLMPKSFMKQYIQKENDDLINQGILLDATNSEYPIIRIFLLYKYYDVEEEQHYSTLHDEDFTLSSTRMSQRLINN